PRNAWEAHSDSRFVTTRCGNDLEGDLEHQLWRYCAHRPEAFQRVLPDPTIDSCDLAVAQSGIRFGNRHEGLALAHSKRVVGEQIRTPAEARFGVEQDAVELVRCNLPLPPGSTLPARRVRRLGMLQHHSFDASLTRCRPQCLQLAPLVAPPQRRSFG